MRERAAAEVVARRRGQVGDRAWRRRRRWSRRRAGRPWRGSRSAPTRSTACARCSPARRRARPRARRRAGAGRGARACRRRRGSRPRWPPRASRSRRASSPAPRPSTPPPAAANGAAASHTRVPTGPSAAAAAVTASSSPRSASSATVVAPSAAQRRRHVGGAARGGDDDALEQPGAQHGRGTIRGATLQCMAPAVHPKRASLPLPGGSEGAGVTVTPMRTAEMLTQPRFFQRPSGPLATVRGLGLLTPKSKWTWVPVPCFLVEHPTAGAVPHRHRPAARGLPRRPRRARTARGDRLRHPHGGRLGGHRSARRARPRPAGHRARGPDPHAPGPRRRGGAAAARDLRRRRARMGGRRPTAASCTATAASSTTTTTTGARSTSGAEQVGLVRLLRPRDRPVRRRLGAAALDARATRRGT